MSPGRAEFLSPPSLCLLVEGPSTAYFCDLSANTVDPNLFNTTINLFLKNCEYDLLKNIAKQAERGREFPHT